MNDTFHHKPNYPASRSVGIDCGTDGKEWETGNTLRFALVVAGSWLVASNARMVPATGDQMKAGIDGVPYQMKRAADPVGVCRTFGLVEIRR